MLQKNTISTVAGSWVWWYVPVITEFSKQGREDHELEASQGYTKSLLEGAQASNRVPKTMTENTWKPFGEWSEKSKCWWKLCTMESESHKTVGGLLHREWVGHRAWRSSLVGRLGPAEVQRRHWHKARDWDRKMWVQGGFQIAWKFQYKSVSLLHQ